MLFLLSPSLALTPSRPAPPLSTLLPPFSLLVRFPPYLSSFFFLPSSQSFPLYLPSFSFLINSHSFPLSLSLYSSPSFFPICIFSSLSLFFLLSSFFSILPSLPPFFHLPRSLPLLPSLPLPLLFSLLPPTCTISSPPLLFSLSSPFTAS